MPMQIQECSRPERLRWLDVAQDYLTTDGTRLNPSLAFDGTHMAPTFLQHVSQAIAALE